MDKSISLFFLIYINFLKVNCSKDNTKLVSLKFKTFHPLTYNRIYNKTGFDK